MSQTDLYEHRGYLADARKIAAYRAALAEVVGPADVVLDLGAGTGMLGYLACEAGAKSVIAVDRSDIIGLARRIAEDNGYAERISHVEALSTEMAPDTLADVVVCDQIGGLVHDAGVLACFADARERLLRPGATFVPASFRIFFAPVTFDIGREAIEFWSSRPSCIDVSAARSLAANTEWKYNIVADDLLRLAQPEQLAAFASDSTSPIKGSVKFEVAHPGRLDGFIGWFEAQMSPSVTLTNDPWSPERFDRWCNFYAIDPAIDVDGGDRVHLAIDIRPRLGVVAWTTDVIQRDGRMARSRRSTFASSFLTISSLDSVTPSVPVPQSVRVELLRKVIDLIDGVRTQADIVDALRGRVGTGINSLAHLENFVRRVAVLAR